MSAPLELSIDKFLFLVATDRRYDDQGVWVIMEEGRARIGLSDFLQQRSGDIAFCELKPIGSVLAAGDEIANVETIKVDLAVAAPIGGKVVETNPLVDTAPERINIDPYGDGWLAVVEPVDWDHDQANLLDPDAYLELMKQQAREEIGA